MARLDSPKRREQRDRSSSDNNEFYGDHDKFYESIAAPARQSYYEPGTAGDYTPVEQVVQIVAGILNLLLALRFVMALFTSDTSNAFVAVLFAATDWLVAPFQSLFASPPPTNGIGFFDLPALAAIVAVWVLAWIISMIARGSKPDSTS